MKIETQFAPIPLPSVLLYAGILLTSSKSLLSPSVLRMLGKFINTRLGVTVHSCKVTHHLELLQCSHLVPTSELLSH